MARNIFDARLVSRIERRFSLWNVRSEIERRTRPLVANFVKRDVDVFSAASTEYSSHEKRKWFFDSSISLERSESFRACVWSRWRGFVHYFCRVHITEIILRQYITYLWMPYLLIGCFPQKPYCFAVNTINLARKNFLNAFPRHRCKLRGHVYAAEIGVLSSFVSVDV